VKALKRNDPAPFRLDPVKSGIVGALRHRKNAAGIGLQQNIRRDLDEGGFTAGHGSSRSSA
jgi:hypothetical protein